MQKLQYKHEKRLLSQQAILHNKKISAKGDKTTSDITNETKDAENDEIDLELSLSDPDEIEKEANETTRSNMKSNLGSATGRTTSGAQTSRSALGTGTVSAMSNRKGDVFNKNMEERAKVREATRKEREEKRKKMELERLELLKAQQDEKLKVEEEERRKKNEELKAKRNAQRLLDEKRNAEKLKEQESQTKADAFYRKYLLRYYGMNGFKKIIELKRNNLNTAHKHYSLVLFRKVIDAWRFNIRIDLVKRQQLADSFNRRLLLKNYLNNFKKYKQCAQIASAKATRFYKYQIKLKLFEAWKFYRVKEKRAACEHERVIKEHNELRMRRTYFLIWKQFPAEIKRFRLRQKRIDDLRSKVREMIPDYETPTSLSTMQNSTSASSSIK